MRNKIKKASIILSCTALIGVIVYFIIGNPIVFINNQKLGHAIKSIESQTVQLNDVIPFEWDTLYTFPPYVNHEEIEQIIGFKSAAIRDNQINEGMVHLLFVRDDQVVASILGYRNNLGYSIDFISKDEMKVTFEEDAQFNVIRTDGVTTLIYEE